MQLDFTKKPKIIISLDPLFEAYCRFIFNTPQKQKEIVVNRKKDIGKLINSNVSSSDLPVKRPFIVNPVVFILPVNPVNRHSVSSHFLKVSSWGEQKIQDGIEYEYRKWVERRFEIGYEKKWSQKEIIDAVIRGLNVRNNAANFDAVKKIDYRNRRKTEEKRFQQLLYID